jgi:pilus assembly protein CpaF
VQISEVTGYEGDVINMHDLFTFETTGLDEQRRAQGVFWASGLRPKCLERLQTAGCAPPPCIFERQPLQFDRFMALRAESVRP